MVVWPKRQDVMDVGYRVMHCTHRSRQGGVHGQSNRVVWRCAPRGSTGAIRMRMAMKWSLEYKGDGLTTVPGALAAWPRRHPHGIVLLTPPASPYPQKRYPA